MVKLVRFSSLMQVISNFVQGAVREVFSTMANLEVNKDSQLAEKAPPAQYTGVMGSVSFTGKMVGTLYLNMPDRLAAEIASKLMGNSPDDIGAEDVNDVVGELTNMVTGNLKSKMCDQGYACTLSIPTVLRGTDIKINSMEQHMVLSGEFLIDSNEHKVNVCVFARLENQ